MINHSWACWEDPRWVWFCSHLGPQHLSQGLDHCKHSIIFAEWRKFSHLDYTLIFSFFQSFYQNLCSSVFLRSLLSLTLCRFILGSALEALVQQSWYISLGPKDVNPLQLGLQAKWGHTWTSERWNSREHLVLTIASKFFLKEKNLGDNIKIQTWMICEKVILLTLTGAKMTSSTLPSPWAPHFTVKYKA